MYFHPINSLTVLNRRCDTEPVISAHFKWFFYALSFVLYGSLMPIIGHGICRKDVLAKLRDLLNASR